MGSTATAAHRTWKNRVAIFWSSSTTIVHRFETGARIRQCSLRRQVMSEWKDKLEGKAKELKGKVTGDRVEELKGKAQQVRGEAKGKLNDVKGSWERRQAERTQAGEPAPTQPYPGEGYQPEEGQPVE
jgi:uncharacterized protein YjbJ (UPF0337 family)